MVEPAAPPPLVPPGLFASILGDIKDWNITFPSGGANSLVMILEKDGERHVLKDFGDRPGPRSRDRFQSERAFYEWTAHLQYERVPEALSWSDHHHAALLQYVEGNPVRTVVGIDEVRMASQFILSINKDRKAARKFPLPEAADTGDWRTQFEKVSLRIQRLLELTAHASLQEELHNFLQTELFPSWEAVSNQFQEHLAKDAALCALREEELILSPSDFGFHNTLLASDGALKFFDFEYAGWDDPAKTAADFLRQPRHYIPSHLWWDFLASLAPLFPDASRFYQRVRILAPLHNIKWCCIFLNEFLPEKYERRREATGKDPMELETLRAQIGKARNHLETFEQIPDEAWPT